MPITFAHLTGKPPKFLLLTEPFYVRHVLSFRHTAGASRVLQNEFRRVMAIFNAKPIFKQCSGRGCKRNATRASVYRDNIATRWWCDECDPYQAGASRGKLQMVKTYMDALQHVDAFCGGHVAEYKMLVGKLIVAKGLTERVTQARAEAFLPG